MRGCGRYSRTNCWRLRKRPNQDDHPPSLFIRQPLFEGRHWFPAFGQLVKKLAVGDAAHMPHIAEVRRLRIIKRRIMAIASSGQAVTRRAFVAKNRPNRLEIGRRRRNRILHLTRRRWDRPGPIFPDCKTDRARNDEQQNDKQDFSYAEIFGLPRRHIGEESFARSRPKAKDYVTRERSARDTRRLARGSLPPPATRSRRSRVNSQTRPFSCGRW